MQFTSSEPNTSAPLRILVVDDNHDSAESLMMLLRLYHYETNMAFDGNSALEIASQFEPDILLIDIGLPDMTGYELATKVRSLNETKNAIVIAVTGHAEDQEKSKAAGFNYHFTKPIDLDLLKTKLAELAP